MATRAPHSLLNGEGYNAASVGTLDRRPHASLQSWKEIAAELGRGVRTVQRWEKKLGLPVRRVGKGPAAPVFAFRDELHRWLGNANPNVRTTLVRSAPCTISFEPDSQPTGSKPCKYCGSRPKSLIGKFKMSGTTMTWTLSVSFCPVCEAAALQCISRLQIIH